MIKHRVVLTSNTSFSLYNFRKSLMQKLREENFEVHAVAPEDEYSPLLKEEFFFHPLVHLDRKGTNPLKDFLLLREYLRLYRKIKPNLVISYTIKPNIYSSLSCRMLKIHTISVVTGLGYVFTNEGLLKFLVQFLYKIALSKNRYVVFQNQGYLSKIYNFFIPSSSIVIPGSGVNVDYFNPKYCSKERTRNKTVFLFIGRFLKHKGLFELISASERLWQETKNFEVWLLGSSDKGNPASVSEKELECFKKMPFLRLIAFTKDVRFHLCKADCIVLPTYYGEGVPRSLLEAMSMEKPIITTDIPGCRELVVEGNGLLVNPRDVENLYEKMREFLTLNQEEKKEMGKKGRELVLRKYDEKIIIEKYLELINEILNYRL